LRRRRRRPHASGLITRPAPEEVTLAQDCRSVAPRGRRSSGAGRGPLVPPESRRHRPRRPKVQFGCAR
jgi:hypothetical protein